MPYSCARKLAILRIQLFLFRFFYDLWPPSALPRLSFFPLFCIPSPPFHASSPVFNQSVRRPDSGPRRLTRFPHTPLFEQPDQVFHPITSVPIIYFIIFIIFYFISCRSFLLSTLPLFRCLRPPTPPELCRFLFVYPCPLSLALPACLPALYTAQKKG
ncbi:hypothetical protein BJY01DRAFT_64994 [Aspergillus pseudoustus]|uniref:Uncharacterized protein n=1 Tax=Aspergillus pseudoustus TaxID=1810923 RepID=A0ABR4KMG7_9EURO